MDNVDVLADVQNTLYGAFACADNTSCSHDLLRILWLILEYLITTRVSQASRGLGSYYADQGLATWELIPFMGQWLTTRKTG